VLQGSDSSVENRHKQSPLSKFSRDQAPNLLRKESTDHARHLSVAAL
jgi:hypothetical protein